jgi:hypothetical protein
VTGEPDCCLLRLAFPHWASHQSSLISACACCQASNGKRGFSLSGTVILPCPGPRGHFWGRPLLVRLSPPAPVGGALRQTEVSDQLAGTRGPLGARRAARLASASRRDPGRGRGTLLIRLPIWKWRWNDDLDGGSGERQRNAGLLAGLLFSFTSLLSSQATDQSSPEDLF